LPPYHRAKKSSQGRLDITTKWTACAPPVIAAILIAFATSAGYPDYRRVYYSIFPGILRNVADYFATHLQARLAIPQFGGDLCLLKKL
jgi:hypothetical protein